MSKENKTSDKQQNGNDFIADVMGSILSVCNGWGEASTFIRIDSFYEKIKIAKIEKETKVLGAGYYNDLTINCYVAYSEDGRRLIEINDGANVEVRYCP
jgi:predicted PolB exonuclease-like 3'-5' exonuclease